MGELIDRSAATWRRDFWTLFRLYLVLQLAGFIVAKGYELFIARFAPLIRGGAKLMAAMEQQQFGVVFRQYAWALTGTVVMAVVTLSLSWIVGVVGSHYAVRRHLGQPATIADGIRRARERLGTVIGALALSTVWGVAAAIVSVIPGGILIGLGAALQATSSGEAGQAGGIVLVAIGVFVMGLGLIIAVLWIILRFLLTAPVIAMEDVTAWQAIQRSGALISGRVGDGFLNRVKVRATLLLTLIFVILTVVGMVAGIPAMIVQFVYSNPLDPAHADPDAIPQLLLIPAQLLQVFAQAVFSPLYLVFCALFYVDMRVRREGLDLELKLAQSPNT